MRIKRFFFVFLVAVSVFLLFLVPFVSAEVVYTVEHGSIGDYGSGVTVTGAPYENFTGHFDASLLTVDFTGVDTYIVFELYNNVSEDGIAIAYGRYQWYYYYSMLLVLCVSVSFLLLCLSCF